MPRDSDQSMSTSRHDYFLDKPFNVAVHGLTGCTSVVVVSEESVWVSHFWETHSAPWDAPYDYSFDNEAHFGPDVLNQIEFGGPLVDGLRPLRDFSFPFADYTKPFAIIVSPGITTTTNAPIQLLRYARQVNSISALLYDIFAGVENFSVDIQTYVPMPGEIDLEDEEGNIQGTEHGKVIVQYDPEHVPLRHETCQAQRARARVWVEGNVVADRKWTAHGAQLHISPGSSRKRDSLPSSCSLPATATTISTITSVSVSSLRASRTSTDPGQSSITTIKSTSVTSFSTSTCSPTTFTQEHVSCITSIVSSSSGTLSCATSVTTLTGCEERPQPTTQTSTATVSPTRQPCAKDCLECRALLDPKAQPTKRPLSRRHLHRMSSVEKRRLPEPSSYPYRGDFDDFLNSEIFMSEKFDFYREDLPGPVSISDTKDLLYKPWTTSLQGLYGCTSVVILSRKGVYLSHFWQQPSFESMHNFRRDVLDQLENGGQGMVPLWKLRLPGGALAADTQPIAIVVTPQEYTPIGPLMSDKLLYPAMVKQIVDFLSQIFYAFPGFEVKIQDYKSDGQLPEMNGVRGRYLIQYDPAHIPADPCIDQPQRAALRMWTEDQFREFIEWDAYEGQLVSGSGEDEDGFMSDSGEDERLAKRSYPASCSLPISTTTRTSSTSLASTLSSTLSRSGVSSSLKWTTLTSGTKSSRPRPTESETDPGVPLYTPTKPKVPEYTPQTPTVARPTKEVDHGDLVCGNPNARGDMGNPEYWMKPGKQGESGMVDGASRFCDMLVSNNFKIDPERPPGGKILEWSYHYNQRRYDPILFEIEWIQDKKCPIFDMVSSPGKAVEMCKSRLSNIIHKCKSILCGTARLRLEWP